MYLQRIRVKYMEPCFADTKKIRLKAEFPRDVSELLPYMNAVIPNAVYTQQGPFLSFTKEFRLITVYPGELTVIKAINSTDAYQILEWLRELMNDIYDQRSSITPSYDMRRRPSILALFQLLPQDKYNCGQCGERTCLAFSLFLWSGEQKLENCHPLAEPQYLEEKKALQDLLGHK